MPSPVMKVDLRRMFRSRRRRRRLRQRLLTLLSSGSLGSRPFVQADARRGPRFQIRKMPPWSLQPLYPKKQSLGEKGPFWAWRSGVKGGGTPRLPSTTLVGPLSFSGPSWPGKKMLCDGKCALLCKYESNCTVLVVLSTGNAKCLRVVRPITLAAYVQYWEYCDIGVWI
jgi:hypothetical protein